MFDKDAIKTAYTGLFGLRQSLDPDFAPLGAVEVAGDEKYNDIHPLINQENLDAITENYDGYTVTAWSGLTTYALGGLAKSTTGQTYISLQATNLNHALTDQDWWETPLTRLIRETEEQSAIKTFNRSLREKKMFGATKSKYSNLILYDGEGRSEDTITKEGRFVFLKITLAEYDNLRFLLKRLGLQTTLVQTDLPIYIFHSSRRAYYFRVLYSSDKTYTMEWFPMNKALDYFPYSATDIAREIDAGGSFYLGYFEDDLNGQAINRSYDWQEIACGTCPYEHYNEVLFNTRMEYANVHAGYVADTDLNGTDMWDVEDNVMENKQTWGLNIGFSIDCVMTQFFVDNTRMFSDVFSKQVVSDFLTMMSLSTRSNRLKSSVKAEALMELSKEGKNWNTILDKAYEEADFDTSDLTSPCLDEKQNGLTSGFQ